MRTYCLLFTVLFASSLYAQDTIKSKQYLFPDFAQAIVYYKGGSGTRHFMNYNLIIDEMQFLNDKDEKEPLEGFEEIEYISFGLRRFITLELDFAEVISESDQVALVVKRFTDVKKQQGIGKLTGGSRSKTNKLLEKNEPLSADIVLTADSTYYLVRLVKPQGVKKGVFKGLSLSQNRVVDATLNGFLKIYADDKEKINEFVTKENINFNIPADIVRLAEFCYQLQ